MSKKMKLIPELRFPEFRVEEGWELEKVDDLIDQHSEKSDYSNQYPVLTSAREGIMFQRDYYNDRDVASKDNTGYNVVPRGYFTYRHMSDDLIFKFNINNICDRGIVSTLYPVFKVKNEKVLPYFFQQKLNEGPEFRKFAFSQKQGGSRTYMYLNKLKNLGLYIPKLPEQQKIASCLSSLDELIAAHKEKLDALKDHKKGLMQNLFPQEGQKVPKVRFPEFENDGEWEEKALGSVFNTFSGGTPKSTEKKYYGGSIPFIRSGEIAKTYTELFLTKEGLDNSSAKMVQKGDLLIALYGANSGEVSISKIEGAINQAILCLRSEFSNGFVSHYFYHMKDWIVRRYIQGGQGNLSGEIVKSVELFFPSQEEQEKIASCFSAMDELITAQTEKIEELQQHKKGLMQGLFPKIEN